MNTVDDTWENAKGEKLTMPLTKESADSLTMVLTQREKRRDWGPIWQILMETHIYISGTIQKVPQFFIVGGLEKGGKLRP